MEQKNYYSKTYQDYEKIKQSGSQEAIMEFVKSLIEEYKSTPEYKTAETASAYDKQQNTFMRNYKKMIVLATGEAVEDRFSPNHKVCSNFYHQFVTDLANYVLANGVSFGNKDTKDKLGKDFDEKIIDLTIKAMHGKRAYGFYNKDHLEVFSNYKSTDNAIFAGLEDEETGVMRAGVRFWQIDDLKPMFAVLYDEQEYITYVFRPGKDGEIKYDWQPYIKNYQRLYGETTYTSGNIKSTIPIFTMWGNGQHTSEIEGMKETIDLYDLTLNANGNDLDSALLYWVVHGGEGMNQKELVHFLKQMQSQRVASVDNDRAIEPVTVSPPTEARERLLALLERRLYDDFGMLDITTLSAGNVTATQITAAYERMDMKASALELEITKFIRQLLEYLGIDDTPTYTRSRLINRQETINILTMLEPLLTREYRTRKGLEMLDDGDKADDMIVQKEKEARDSETSMYLNQMEAAAKMNEEETKLAGE